ncbi:hypothetical protein SAMN05216436_10939 [bacterium A37T11]|nr:hypothetical protein SAMN05216436_10939 [bacterium A37T11]
MGQSCLLRKKQYKRMLWLSTYMKYTLVFILYLGCSINTVFSQGETKTTRYFVQASVVQQPAFVRSIKVKQQSGFYPDTLFQVLDKDSLSIAYYRNIAQEVCYDKKCRLLRLNLYWNITGRYLGIELPTGEYLSKTDHVPFTQTEYKRLNEILSDPSSPLAGISYDALATPDSAVFDNLDGITGATTKSMVRYIIPGAAYTTYTLWHLVYSQTQKQIQQITERTISSDQLIRIMSSPSPTDQQWALAHVHLVPLSTFLREKVLKLINDDNYHLAILALNSFSNRQLKSDTVKQNLVNLFIKSGYSIRLLIIEKLFSLDKFSQPTLLSLARELPQLNGEPLLGVFRIFRRQKVKDDQIIAIIRSLINHSNPFIARQAEDYLKFIGKISTTTTASGT